MVYLNSKSCISLLKIYSKTVVFLFNLHILIENKNKKLYSVPLTVSHKGLFMLLYEFMNIIIILIFNLK